MDSTVEPCSCWCPGSVDLPRVNVVAQQDAKVLFSFTHPWMLYSNTRTIDSNRKHRKRKSYDYEPETEELPEELPEFEYTVTMNQVRGYIPVLRGGRSEEELSKYSVMYL